MQMIVAVVRQIAGQNHAMIPLQPIVAVTAEQVICAPVSDQGVITTLAIEPVAAVP